MCAPVCLEPCFTKLQALITYTEGRDTINRENKVIRIEDMVLKS